MDSYRRTRWIAIVSLALASGSLVGVDPALNSTALKFFGELSRLPQSTLRLVGVGIAIAASYQLQLEWDHLAESERSKGRWAIDYSAIQALLFGVVAISAASFTVWDIFQSHDRWLGVYVLGAVTGMGWATALRCWQYRDRFDEKFPVRSILEGKTVQTLFLLSVTALQARADNSWHFIADQLIVAIWCVWLFWYFPTKTLPELISPSHAVDS